jgi:hypothetical protein
LDLHEWDEQIPFLLEGSCFNNKNVGSQRRGANPGHGHDIGYKTRDVSSDAPRSKRRRSVDLPSKGSGGAVQLSNMYTETASTAAHGQDSSFASKSERAACCMMSLQHFEDSRHPKIFNFSKRTCFSVPLAGHGIASMCSRYVSASRTDPFVTRGVTYCNVVFIVDTTGVADVLHSTCWYQHHQAVCV